MMQSKTRKETTMPADPDTLLINPGGPLQGTATVPGDKSISHRTVMLGALAEGTSQVRGWLAAGDTQATLNAVRALGVLVEQPTTDTLVIHGGKLHAPTQPLNLVNAGTGLRLLAGILAGQPFDTILTGSSQLCRRPMRRVTAPLREMGANITDNDGYPPLYIHPARLHGIRYPLPMPSAQVKSALLLAGLFAQGPTTIIQPGPARDHTERLLSAMGAHIQLEDNTITLHPGNALRPIDLTVPGDFSSAAFLIVAASIVPASQVTLRNISINPTRTGLLDVLGQMGAHITVTAVGEAGGDPVGEIVVQSAALGSTTVSGDDVVRMIDEFPLLMVAALCAHGTTEVRDARELRVKESDRIAVMAGELRKLGAVIEEREDGFCITGPQRLRGATVSAHDDHRVAMSLVVAGLIAEGSTTILGAACIADSFPGFANTLQTLGATIR